ncbi:MAG TPA: metalloregulator ArsR/SmtB family transcription factor [Nocardioidaceae bacterium]|nr:metalloregulator ArsR/SmtB family transcription factor [Nocardioidaceae bacterium]
MKTDASRVLVAMADPMRLQALQILRERPLAVTELAERLPISRPAVSQHLKHLAEAGLVTSHSVGRQRRYEIRPEALALLRDWLDVMWRDSLDRFAAAVPAETETAADQNSHRNTQRDTTSHHRDDEEQA